MFSLSCRIFTLPIAGIAALAWYPSVSIAQEAGQSWRDRLRSTAENMAERTLDKVAGLDAEDTNRVFEALLLGIQYGEQASVDEAAGYEFAHQKAAYDWGYRVGDPKIVKAARTFWEGVQLGVFAVGDVQERRGSKHSKWAQLESMIGGNGKEYTVNRAYLDDVLGDIKISTDGAKAAQDGFPNDFDRYREQTGRASELKK